MRTSRNIRPTEPCSRVGRDPDRCSPFEYCHEDKGNIFVPAQEGIPHPDTAQPKGAVVAFDRTHIRWQRLREGTLLYQKPRRVPCKEKCWSC